MFAAKIQTISQTRPAEPVKPPISAWSALWRGKSLLFITSLVALLGGIAFLAYARPSYQATALVSIDPKFDGVLSKPQSPTDATADSALVATEVEILQSEAVARAVVANEGLDKDPAFLRPGLRDTLRDLLARYGLNVSSPNPQTDRQQRAINALTRHVTIKRVDATYVVAISANMPDGESAARIANAYARVFIATRLDGLRDRAKRTSELLNERALDLQRRVTEAETALETLRMQGADPGSNAATTKVALRNLESSAQTYRALYEKLLEGYAEAQESTFTVGSRVQLVSSASAPLTKNWPNTIFILAASLAIGIAIGSVAALLRASA